MRQSTRLSLALMSKNAMTLSGPTSLGYTRLTLFATLKSEIKSLQTWKSERAIVGECRIMQDRGLTD
jgi:hypothetical protein